MSKVLPGMEHRFENGMSKWSTSTTFTKAELVAALENIADDEEILVRVEPAPYLLGIVAVQMNIMKVEKKITIECAKMNPKLKVKVDKDVDELATLAKEIVSSEEFAKRRGRPKKSEV